MLSLHFVNILPQDDGLPAHYNCTQISLLNLFALARTVILHHDVDGLIQYDVHELVVAF